MKITFVPLLYYLHSLLLLLLTFNFTFFTFVAFLLYCCPIYCFKFTINPFCTVYVIEWWPCFLALKFFIQFALTTVALLILVITSRTHPYTKKWANFAEGLILLDLVFISAYFLDYNRLSSTSDNTFVIVLLILPFIHFFIYLLIKALR